MAYRLNAVLAPQMTPSDLPPTRAHAARGPAPGDAFQPGRFEHAEDVASAAAAATREAKHDGRPVVVLDGQTRLTRF